MASTIGIKLANGEFYPVLKENSQEKKRLVLTTVHDDQRSIQIDLYRSSSRTMADALYIGSLVMEKITPQPRGQPSIELIIASSEDGDITANALDLDVGTEGRQTLSVSLKSLDEVRQDYVISDLDLEDDLGPPTGLYEPAGEMRQKRSWLPKVIIIALILILIILAIWFLFFRGGGILPCIQALFQGPQSQALEQPQAPAVSQQPAAPAAQPAAPAASVAQTPAPQPAAPAPPPAQTETPTPPVPVIQAPAEPPPSVQVTRARPTPPVASYNVPSVIPREGVAYRIRYGDTLWDISEAFYRNPWLYPQIARFNNIRNPDRIISGTTIRVPPRN